jgi:hypothetical protein
MIERSKGEFMKTYSKASTYQQSAKITPSKSIKRLADDKLYRDQFIEMVTKYRENHSKTEKLQKEYDAALARILAKYPDIRKMKDKLEDMQARDLKLMEKIEKFIDMINEKLREGYKSMYFLLEAVISTRRTISYKSVCEKLVKDRKVSRKVMDEYYEMFAHYIRRETTKFLDDKKDKFIEIYTFLQRYSF